MNVSANVLGHCSPMRKTEWEYLSQTSWERSEARTMEANVLPVGSLVYVTCYGPCWGLRGIIRAIDVITLASTQESVYFYLVTLQEGQMREPLWLVHDDVAVVEGHGVASRHSRSGDTRTESKRVLVREDRVS